MKAVPSSQSTRMPKTGGALNGNNQPVNIVQPSIRTDNTRKPGATFKIR